MDGCGWPRGGVGRERGLAFYLNLPLPHKGQVQCGVTWGGCGQSSSGALCHGSGRVFAPPEAGFTPAVFALLPPCHPASTAPRACGEQDAVVPGQAPRLPGTAPVPRVPGQGGTVVAAAAAVGWRCGGAGPGSLPRSFSFE